MAGEEIRKTYRFELSGCGHKGAKSIDLELSEEDAAKLRDWDLDDLDCCGGPLTSMEEL